MKALTLAEQRMVVEELLNRWRKRWVGVQTSGPGEREERADARGFLTAYGPVEMKAPGRSAVGLGAIHCDPREGADIVLAPGTAAA